MELRQSCWCTVLTFAWASLMGCTSHASGQSSCVATLHFIPKLEVDQGNAAWYHTFSRAVELTQELASEGLANKREATDAFVDVRGVGDSLWSSIRGSPERIEVLTTVLATIIEGKGLKLGDAQGTVASSLYDSWKLPPKAALSVLADPRQRPRARMLAVRSISTHWRDSSFVDASMAALCELAASANANRSLLSASPETGVERLLNSDELELLMQIKRAYASRNDPAYLASRIRQTLPKGDRVAETMLDFLRALR